MRSPFGVKSWSPYLVGAGLGVLSWLAFWSAEHPLGITSAMENTSALVLGAFTREAGVGAYYEQHTPRIGWEWALVVGVFFGSLISALWSGDREKWTVPPLWQARFGSSRFLRLFSAFIGGALMLIGARLADGCTSGHGISGTLQLAVSSWIFVATLFVTGIIVSFLLYGKAGRRHV